MRLVRQERPYTYTVFQKSVHGLPEHVSRFLGGGRGGGKSEAMAQAVAVRAMRYKERARILILRKGPYKSMNDLITTFRQIFNRYWGIGAHRLNRSEHVWHVPTGSYIELGILPDGRVGREYYETAYQGRSFTDLFIDEAQQWARPENIDLMLSNLRDDFVPTLLMMNANPGGIGHQWIAQRFITGHDIWEPFQIDKTIKLGNKEIHTSRTWQSCPSTYVDNPYLGEDYLANLAISCGHDDDLLKAWITGNWNISRGAYFAAVLDNQKIEINWPLPDGWDTWQPLDWKFWLAFDHGTMHPSVCYVMARSPGGIGPDGRFYPADSILMLDEYACHRPTDLAASFGWTVPEISGPILSLADRWRIPARGVADDACFSHHGHANQFGQELTIADDYASEGVVWTPARKGRRAARCLRMKRMLASAGDFEREGLYVSKKCNYWWQTVPFLVHDPNDTEVLLKCDTDHGFDASSMGLSGGQVTGGAAMGI